jgi:alpha,alpha-trehalose phosphorylase
VVQSVVAAEVGYADAAWGYFRQALHVDLANLHGNTDDGLHVASAGGVWAALVNGFAGMRDHGGRLSFDPRLPDAFPVLRCTLRWQGHRLALEVRPDRLCVSVLDGTGPVCITVRGHEHEVDADRALVVRLDARGTRLPHPLDDRPQLGGTRADGSRITAGVPAATL